ncbi:hypothetical protein FOA52_000575 [Chlamydomonas sp. UWO 241]|nr:hypothetical protein FOA52_000575 [Chlamydomonas sp. UWO 241]
MANPRLVIAVKALALKDLRAGLRARGYEVGGGEDELKVRLATAMEETGDYSGLGVSGGPSYTPAGGNSNNNYARPSGQNVGNFLTDKPSSRVLAPPGGKDSVVLGDYKESPQQAAQRRGMTPAKGGPTRGNSRAGVRPAPQKQEQEEYNEYEPQAVGDMQLRDQDPKSQSISQGNNYARADADGNVGNYLTDKSSSRVLAPPGGKDLVVLGSDEEAPAVRYAGHGVGGVRGASPMAGRRAPKGARPPTGQKVVKPQTAGNNYARADASGNVGNYLTGKPSSKVLAPPGGKDSVVLGTYEEPATVRYAGHTNGGATATATATGVRAPSPMAGRRAVATPRAGGGMYGKPPNSPMTRTGEGMGGAAGARAPSRGGVPPRAPTPAFESHYATGQSSNVVGNNYARPGGSQNLGNYMTDKPSSKVLAPPGGRSTVVLG